MKVRLTPLLIANIVGAWTGVGLASVIDQYQKEIFWNDHPGERVPYKKPFWYLGPYDYEGDSDPQKSGSSS